MDLINEEDIAFLQRGEDGCQIARVLNRRSRRQAQRTAHLVGNDHRQGGLAQSGRTRQKDVIGNFSPPDGGLEHQRELLAHHLLTNEVFKVARAQRSLGRALGIASVRHDKI